MLETESNNIAAKASIIDSDCEHTIDEALYELKIKIMARHKEKRAIRNAKIEQTAKRNIEFCQQVNLFIYIPQF